MRRILTAFILGLLGTNLALAGAIENTSDSRLPSVAANFRLFDHQGGSYELQQQFLKPAVVVVSVNADCPLAKQDAKYLKALTEEYSEQNVRFLMIDPTLEIDRTEVDTYAKEKGISLPILLDESQMVAHTLGIKTTGEALLIDTSDWSILYRGSVRNDEAEHLKNALGALLSGEEVPVSFVKPNGKPVSYKEAKSNVTYIHDIAPLLEARCVECHRKGDIGPFPMSGYSRIRTYAPMIKEVVLAKRMPPWHADPHIADYSNGEGIQPDELITLLTWIENGTPRGDGQDPLTKYGRDKDSQWALGEPDFIVTMNEPVNLAAEGVFDYHNDYAEVEMKEDKWLRAIEVMPGNRAVVHHSLIFLSYPEHLKHLQPEWGGGTGGYFAGYGPGFETLEFPEGTAKFLPAGATIRFQMHYTATGKPETDLSSIGFYFYDGEPEMEYVTRGASNYGIHIEPRGEDQEFEAMFYVSEPIKFWSMAPHMHYRGSRFKYIAQLPDGTEKEMLSIPFYDFNWQREYRLPEPLELPRGTTIKCIAGYNNSETNPNNPDPEDTVTWGSQSWEEMLIGHLSFAKQIKDKTPNKKEYGFSMGESITEENIIGTEWRWRNYRVYFLEPGKAIVNDSMTLDWEVKGKMIFITLGDRKMPVNVQEDKMKLLGQPLAFLGRHN